MIRITEGYEAARAEPAGLRDADRPLFAHEFRKTIPTAHLRIIDHAHVLDDLVTTLLPPKHHRTLTYSNDRGVRVEMRLAALYAQRLPMLFRKARRIDQALWITDDVSRGYFHWFTDALCRLQAARTHLPHMPLLLHEDLYRSNFIRASLEMLGETNILVHTKGEHVVVDRLHVPEHPARTGNYNEPLLRQVRDAFSNGATSNTERNVFVSRSKAPTRRILNEEILVPIMHELGVEVVNMEDHGFAEQVKMMQGTSTLIGMHGAGLTNMLFMPPGGKVLEIRIKNDAHNNCYFAMASALGHAYHYILAEGNHVLTQLADVEVDIGEFERSLRRLLNEA